MVKAMSTSIRHTQQYGFVKGRNTVIQLIMMFDQWSMSLEESG